MKPQCRVVITTKCNMGCEYCCMKQEKVLETFQKIRPSEIPIILNNYSILAITGGEPMLNAHDIFNLAAEAKRRDMQVFLYSNGTLLSEIFLVSVASLIDGITIGMHNYHISYSEILTINRMIPVRLLVWEKEINTEFIDFCLQYNIPYRAWRLDDCDNTEYEDRFILED